MEIALVILIVGITNILCFIKGAQIGQKVVKNEEITTPDINPIKVIAQRKEMKAHEKEMDKFNSIMENIDSYDGTGANQKEV